MWAVVSACVTGTSHHVGEIPCQDACHVMRAKIAGKEVLLCAIADGAGSATHSHIGSREAVQHLLTLVSQCDAEPQSITQEQVRGWYEGVLEHLGCCGEREGVPIRELACTLLMAIVWNEGAILAQIGDGAWVLEKDAEITMGTWPDQGEYANVTVFVTTFGALDTLQFEKVEGTISGIAGFTDGIQSVVLDYAKKQPHERFFARMLMPLRNIADETTLVGPLEQLLASDLFNDRTDDDKTLVLAAWLEPKIEEQPHGPVE